MSIKTIYYEKWSYNSKGSLSNRQSRTESYDDEYGVASKGVRTPFYLGLVQNGIIKEKWAALTELKKPIWGNDVPFGELLPDVPTLPSPTISLVHGRVYNEAPDFFKPTEFGSYELWKLIGGTQWQKIVFPYNSESELMYWDILKQYGAFTHFKKEGDADYIPNPDYEPAVQEQTAKLIEAENLIKNTFRIIGGHIFPALPLNDRVIAQLLVQYGDPTKTPYFATADDIPSKMLYNWFEVINGIKNDIPEDPNHPLAYPYPGWKTIRRPMKPESEVDKWDDFAYRLIGFTDPIEKCKRILKIM